MFSLETQMAGIGSYNSSVICPHTATSQTGRVIHPIVFGNLELKLARTSYDIEAAQKLRYSVFYEEMGANPSPRIKRLRLDNDEFDGEADHLLVIDRQLRNNFSGRGRNPVIGTYRLLQRSHLGPSKKFYTANEFDISKILSFPGKILELGRSCVDINYRNRVTLQLLWQGIAAYVFSHKIDLMFGCASFPGTQPEKHQAALAYLRSQHQAPQIIRPCALPKKYVDMGSKHEAIGNGVIKINNLPPLIKGYLRVGGQVGDGAVIDNQFNTTDVCVIVKTATLPIRYRRHYERSFPKFMQTQ
jgi:putative hemolysin